MVMSLWPRFLPTLYTESQTEIHSCEIRRRTHLRHLKMTQITRRSRKRMHAAATTPIKISVERLLSITGGEVISGVVTPGTSACTTISAVSIGPSWRATTAIVYVSSTSVSTARSRPSPSIVNSPGRFILYITSTSTESLTTHEQVVSYSCLQTFTESLIKFTQKPGNICAKTNVLLFRHGGTSSSSSSTMTSSSSGGETRVIVAQRQTQQSAPPPKKITDFGGNRRTGLESKMACDGVTCG